MKRLIVAWGIGVVIFSLAYAEAPFFTGTEPHKSSPSAEETKTKHYSGDEPQKSSVSGQDEVKTPASDDSLAEEFTQKDGAFSIDVPERWRTEVKEDGVEIIWIVPREKNDDGPQMRIHLTRRADPAQGVMGLQLPIGVKEEDLADQYGKQAVCYYKSSSVAGIIITSEKRLKIDGRYAYQVDTIADLRPIKGALTYTSMYGWFTKDYHYEIFITSTTEDKRSEMDGMLNTIKVKR